MQGRSYCFSIIVMIAVACLVLSLTPFRQETHIIALHLEVLLRGS